MGKILLLLNDLIQLLINKNIMLQPIGYSHPIKHTLVRNQNNSPPSNQKTVYNGHILNLNIEENIKPISRYYQNKTIDNNFQTFYNSTNISWRVSNIKHKHLNQRKVATSDRQSIVGTPFNSLELAENEDGTAILPLMDREHYRYLIKAISGIKKGRQLSEIRYKDSLEPAKPFQPSQKMPNRHKIADERNPQKQEKSHQNQFQSSYAPNIVNISPQLKSRKQKRDISESKNNSFEKIFKNKRKLQNKYFQEKHQDNTGFQVSILGEEELTIHQINWGKHRKVKNHHHH